jgi:transcriptional regulator with XRE-family HTH domain
MSDARKLAHLTQKQMAERMGVSTPTVCFWETGKRDIRAKDLDRYLEIVGMTRNDIILPYESTIS